LKTKEKKFNILLLCNI